MNIFWFDTSESKKEKNRKGKKNNTRALDKSQTMLHCIKTGFFALCLTVSTIVSSVSSEKPALDYAIFSDKLNNEAPFFQPKHKIVDSNQQQVQEQLDHDLHATTLNSGSALPVSNGDSESTDQTLHCVVLAGVLVVTVGFVHGKKKERQFASQLVENEAAMDELRDQLTVMEERIITFQNAAVISTNEILRLRDSNANLVARNNSLRGQRYYFLSTNGRMSTDIETSTNQILRLRDSNASLVARNNSLRCQRFHFLSTNGRLSTDILRLHDINASLQNTVTTSTNQIIHLNDINARTMARNTDLLSTIDHMFIDNERLTEDRDLLQATNCSMAINIETYRVQSAQSNFTIVSLANQNIIQHPIATTSDRSVQGQSETDAQTHGTINGSPLTGVSNTLLNPESNSDTATDSPATDSPSTDSASTDSASSYNASLDSSNNSSNNSQSSISPSSFGALSLSQIDTTDSGVSPPGSFSTDTASSSNESFSDSPINSSSTSHQSSSENESTSGSILEPIVGTDTASLNFVSPFIESTDAVDIQYNEQGVTDTSRGVLTISQLRSHLDRPILLSPSLSLVINNVTPVNTRRRLLFERQPVNNEQDIGNTVAIVTNSAGSRGDVHDVATEIFRSFGNFMNGVAFVGVFVGVSIHYQITLRMNPNPRLLDSDDTTVIPSIEDRAVVDASNGAVGSTATSTAASTAVVDANNGAVNVGNQGDDDEHKTEDGDDGEDFLESHHLRNDVLQETRAEYKSNVPEVPSPSPLLDQSEISHFQEEFGPLDRTPSSGDSGESKEDRNETEQVEEHQENKNLVKEFHSTAEALEQHRRTSEPVVDISNSSQSQVERAVAKTEWKKKDATLEEAARKAREAVAAVPAIEHEINVRLVSLTNGANVVDTPSTNGEMSGDISAEVINDDEEEKTDTNNKDATSSS